METAHGTITGSVENRLLGTFLDFGEMKAILVNNQFVIYLTVLATDR
jgi:hypothetical protein